MNNIMDLFCGAGGFSKGFEKAKFNIIAGVDKEEKNIEVWNENHSGKGIVRDLTKTNPRELEETTFLSKDKIDIIIGGPPCQDFSKCNRKINLGRNNLVVLFSKYINHFEPNFFVMENVRQLNNRYTDILSSFKSNLKEYNISHRILNTADYGVPQHRLRTIVIGYKKPSTIPKFPKPLVGSKSDNNKNLVSSGEVLEDVDEPENNKYDCTGNYGELLEEIPEGMNYSFYTEKYNYPEPKYEWRSKFSDFLYKADPKKPIKALKARPGGGTGPFHWKNRRFSIKELKKLHTFDKDFKFTDSYTKTVEQIGNSVPPKFSKIIAYTIRKQHSKYADLEENPVNKLVSSDKNLDIISRKRTDSEVYKIKAKKKLKELGYNIEE